MLEKIKKLHLNARLQKDEVAKNILSLLIGEIEKEELKRSVSDTDCIRIVQKLIKSNDETLSYKDNPVLVEENRILQSVLPQMLSVEEAKSYVVDLNLDLSNLGRAMGSAMKFFKERNLLVEPNVVKQSLQELSNE